MRICVVTALDTKIEIKHGQATIEGPTSKSIGQWINFVLSLTNVSKVTKGDSYDDCAQVFSKNQSDFSFSTFSIHDTRFTIPVPAYPISVYILSGYNLTKYEKEELLSPPKKFDVLENIDAFSPGTYGLIALWMITLFVILMIEMKKVHKRCTFSNVLMKSLRDFFLMMTTGSNRWFLLSLILNFGLFLLLTPFCILFKTNQVVVDEPRLITNYEQIIDQRVQIIYSRIQADPMEYLKLGSDTRTGTLRNRIRKYYSKNSRGVETKRSPETISLLNRLTKEVVENKAVFMGTNVIAEAFRQVLCSWSMHPNLLQVMKFRDPQQEERLQGFIFRMSNPPKKMINRLQRAFESHIPSVLLNSLENYFGIEVLPNPDHHRQKQLLLCQRQHVVEHQKDQVLASSSDFFIHFFTILLALVFVAAVTLCFEVQMA